MKATNSNGLTVEKKTFTEKQTVAGVEKAYSYTAWAITGWLNGKRVRKQAKTQGEALTLKERLEVEAANADGAIRAVNTRLTPAQLTTAETLFGLTPDPLGAVQWYLANYRPAVAETAVEVARDAFIAYRTPHISKGALRDYARTLKFLCEAHSKKSVHAFAAPDVEALLKKHATGPKRHNNMRSDLHAFFNYCMSPARKWTKENPVVGTTRFTIARGIPDILTPQKAAELMAFVETYAGGERANDKPGFLVPYFALTLFAGIRPSVDDGEIRKLADSPEMERLIAQKMGVIRITPGVSKVGEVRQVKIRPNLAAWLARYPLKDFPIVVRNMQDKVSVVRKRFALTDDVSRHTFISAHVAKWKSMGEAALEAGNSERMIKKHYLNMLSDADADAFWGIVPKAGAEAQ